jgi:filamin
MNYKKFCAFTMFVFWQTKIFLMLLQVECFGPGVQRDGVSKGQRAQFTIDTQRAGSAPLDVQVLDANYNNIDVNVRSNGDGTYTAEYIPKTGSRHTVQVQCNALS